jgi:hypothetical protein
VGMWGIHAYTNGSRAPTGGGRLTPSFDIWERSPDRVHQKCPENDAGECRVGHVADDVGWDHETSEVDSMGSHYDRGSVDVIDWGKGELYL